MEGNAVLDSSGCTGSPSHASVRWGCPEDPRLPGCPQRPGVELKRRNLPLFVEDVHAKGKAGKQTAVDSQLCQRHKNCLFFMLPVTTAGCHAAISAWHSLSPRLEKDRDRCVALPSSVALGGQAGTRSAVMCLPDHLLYIHLLPRNICICQPFRELICDPRKVKVASRLATLKSKFTSL